MDWMLFGKIPYEGDFVRINMRSQLSMECFRWIADAVAQSNGLEGLTDHGIKFSFVHSSAPDWTIIGVMMPSQDQVGRIFPIVGAIEIPTGPFADRWPGMPLMWRQALDELRRVLDQYRLGALNELANALAEVYLPDGASIVDSHNRGMHALASTHAAEFHERTFGPDPAATHYAYHTAQVGCSLAGKPTAPTLLCPVAVPTDVVAWLELARRLSPHPNPTPGWAWVGGATPRLALSLSDPPVDTLLAMVGQQPMSNRVWPLFTQNDTARAKARASIEPILPVGDVSIGAVLDALSMSMRNHP